MSKPQISELNFPSHKASLHLEHNMHKAYYETVEEGIENGTYHDTDWISPEQKVKAIATDSVWTLQWYPNSPVGFCKLMACDLDVLLEAALEDEIIKPL